MKIITVYCAYHTDGYTTHQGGIHRTHAQALAASDYPHSPHSKPYVRAALELDNGEVWLLDPGGPYMFTEDVVSLRAKALDKLTQAERDILGVK